MKVFFCKIFKIFRFLTRGRHELKFGRNPALIGTEIFYWLLLGTHRYPQFVFEIAFCQKNSSKIRVVFQVDEGLVTISLKINCELVLRIDFWIRENPERLLILPSSRLIDLWWLSQMMKKVYPDRTKPKIKCLLLFFLNKSLIFYTIILIVLLSKFQFGS